MSLEHFGVTDNHLFFYQLPTNRGLTDEVRDPFVEPGARQPLAGVRLVS